MIVLKGLYKRIVIQEEGVTVNNLTNQCLVLSSKKRKKRKWIEKLLIALPFIVEIRIFNGFNEILSHFFACTAGITTS